MKKEVMVNQNNNGMYHHYLMLISTYLSGLAEYMALNYHFYTILTQFKEVYSEKYTTLNL